MSVTINIRLTFLKTRMDHDLTWIHIICLAILSDVGRSTDVAPHFISVHVLTDGHISIMTACRNHMASSTNFRHWIGTNLGCGCQLAGGCVHFG